MCGLLLFGHRLLVAGKQAAVARDVAIVLGERLAEKMSAVIVGDEVEVVRGGWREGCTQRRFAGVRDWTGRQAGISVRVVWRNELHEVLTDTGPRRSGSAAPISPLRK